MKKIRENYAEEMQVSVVSSSDESELSGDCDPQSPDSHKKSTEWIISGIYLICNYYQRKAPSMQEFLEYFSEITIGSVIRPNYPVRVEYMPSSSRIALRFGIIPFGSLSWVLFRRNKQAP